VGILRILTLDYFEKVYIFLKEQEGAHVKELSEWISDEIIQN